MVCRAALPCVAVGRLLDLLMWKHPTSVMMRRLPGQLGKCVVEYGLMLLGYIPILVIYTPAAHVPAQNPTISVHPCVLACCSALPSAVANWLSGMQDLSGE